MGKKENKDRLQGRHLQLLEVLRHHPYVYTTGTLGDLFNKDSRTIRYWIKELKSFGFQVLERKRRLAVVEDTPLGTSDYLIMAIWRTMVENNGVMLENKLIQQVLKKYGGDPICGEGAFVKDFEVVSAVRTAIERKWLSTDGETLTLLEQPLLSVGLKYQEKILRLIDFLETRAMSSPFFHELEEIRSKLALVSGQPARREIVNRLARKSVISRQDFWGDTIREKINQLTEIIQIGAKAKFSYRRQGKPVSLQMWPTEVFYSWKTGSWSVAGTRGKRKVPPLRLEYITDIQLVNSLRPKSPSLPPEEITVKVYFSEIQKVREMVKRDLASRLASGKATILDVSEGFILEDKVDDLDDFRYWLRRYWSSAQVISPPKLVQMVRDSAERMLSVYEEV